MLSNINNLVKNTPVYETLQKVALVLLPLILTSSFTLHSDVSVLKSKQDVNTHYIEGETLRDKQILELLVELKVGQAEMNVKMLNLERQVQELKTEKTKRND